MFNNSQLIEVLEVLELLNLSYLDNNGTYYIIDPENEDATTIDKKDKNWYGFTIGDISCRFNNNQICIYIGNQEFYICGKDFVYQKKKPQSDYNASLLRSTNNNITFYHSNDEMDSTIIVSSDYDYMTKSSKIRDEYGYDQEDVKVYTDDKPVEAHINRRFDSNGKMVCGSSYTSDINISINDYISNEVKDNELINTVISEINGNIPGIIKLLASYNPVIKDITSINYTTK